MFAWPWVKEVLIKPLVDRTGSIIGSVLIGLGMSQPASTQVVLGFIALAMWGLDVAIITVEKHKKGKL